MPALVLVVLLLLAGIRAGMAPVGIIALVIGFGVLPGVIYKGTKGIFRRLGLSDRWRPNLVTALMFAGTVLCYLAPLQEPVPSTVGALFAGNLGLTFFRRWLNVSAHVSVLTFGVLWVITLYGPALSPLLLLLPVMIISRVTTRDHTLRETCVGSAWGLGTFGIWLAQCWLQWGFPSAVFT